MAPKKDKKNELPDENAWRTVIEEARLDEENWKVKVVLIEAAGSDQDRIYLNKFEIFAAEEKRFVIKNICKTETIFMINQLGGEKKVKDDNLRVFEEGQSYLKEKKDIPPDVLALVIKHLILKMKDEYLYIRRQRLAVKQGMERESATMIEKVEVKGTVSARPPEPPPEQAPPPPPKGKGKGEGDVASIISDRSEGKKFNTSLRVRGEEWRDKVYVDDYPTDGPNLYVAVTGFVEPCLPGCLLKAGIPLTAVVQIRIDPLTSSLPSNLLRPTKRGQSQTEMLEEKSTRFWDDLQVFRIHRDTADDFKNTAFIVFSPPYWTHENLSGNPDKIYDELCFLMYDIQDLSRQHLHYQDNMFIIDIPEHVPNQRYKKCYQHKIDDLPLECVTIYSVVDILLQTACDNREIDETTTRSSLSTAVTLNSPPKNINEEYKQQKAENLVKNVFTTLCNTEARKKSYRLTYGNEYETHKDPIVLGYGDYAKYNTFHLGNINLDNIVFSSLLGMPINNLWRNRNRPSGELEAKVNFHVNVLLSCFDREDVETSELNRLLHILACRKLYNNRSSLKKRHLPTTSLSDFKKNYLKRSVLAKPLPKCPSLATSAQTQSASFPSMTRSEKDYQYAYAQIDPDSEVERLKFLFECPDISELVTAAEIENYQPMNHMIDDFDFFEDHSGTCAFQIMREAFNKFNCVDYKYCEVTDCFILMFFNSHDKDGIAREEWRCHLTTPLCLQDFFDFILDEHYNWIQNEEKIYDEKLIIKARSISKDFIDPNALKSCIETTDVEMDLLMEGSLKYHEMMVAEEETQEDTVTTEAQAKKSTSPVSDDMYSKSSRKVKASIKSGIRAYQGNTECQTSIEIPAKPFLGYDLGDRRVEVFGKDDIFFSKDGTRVTSMYTLIIPMNLEYIVLNVLPGNSYNEFWMHRALGEFVKPEIIDICESFRITTKDQVMMYVKKQTYQVPLPISIHNILSEKKSIFKTASEKASNVFIPTFETKYFHSIYVTWPNGMITETVYENNSSLLSHIKQFYTCRMPHLDEEMRCISLNGEVIIYRASGDVDVLKPDGTFIKIIKYDKRVIQVQPPEPEHDDSSDKTKKVKSKGKLSKGSSKSSKMVGIDEDKLSEEKKPEYELVVEEFEIIETSGLRQKWINDVPCNIEKLLIRTATDYCEGEVFSRRMDGTNILLNKDGLHIVTFPDKTRIITSYVIEDEEIYPEWTDVELEYFEMLEPDTLEGGRSKSSMSQKSYTDMYGSRSSVSKKGEEEEIKQNERDDGYISIQILYSIEHCNFSTISINNIEGKISIDSPNETTVVVDMNNNYDIKLDNATTACFNGERLDISYEACCECKSFTTCSVKIMDKGDGGFSLTKGEQIWLTMTDSFKKSVVVNDEGSISLAEQFTSTDAFHENTANTDDLNETTDCEDKEPDMKSMSSAVSHGKCREMYLAKNIRFFILRRELNCTELLHRTLFDQYKRACRWQPWCSINQYDTFGDHRSLVSILTPVHLTVSEKWLMESKHADKPKYLTYKDLKKDSNKGFYHWMRPYDRFVSKPMKPENVLPERLPRAYILRTLEQQWNESQREQLKGARELLKAVLRYRCIMEADTETLLTIPIIDSRPQDERQIDDIIQALAHKIYEGLKVRLEDDVQTRAKATITTEPALSQENLSVEGEFEEGTMDETKNLEEERESFLKEAESAEEMSPCLRKYWNRRVEEYKEEQFYKYLLREGSVPPYFRNVLGGAIWWDMNNTAMEAVTRAERRKMKCVCSDEQGTSNTESGCTPYMK